MPLRRTLSASGEVDCICKLYYKQTRVSNSKKQRLVNFHDSNYKRVLQGYKGLLGEPTEGAEKMKHSKPDKRVQTAQDFTANVCYGIMVNVMRHHVNSINLTKMVDFTASVCSKIASSAFPSILK